MVGWQELGANTIRDLIVTKPQTRAYVNGVSSFFSGSKHDKARHRNSFQSVFEMQTTGLGGVWCWAVLTPCDVCM